MDAATDGWNGISEFVYNAFVVVVNVCFGMLYSLAQGTYKSMICYTFDAVYPFTNYAFIEISIRVDLSHLFSSLFLSLILARARALSLSLLFCMYLSVFIHAIASVCCY